MRFSINERRHEIINFSEIISLTVLNFELLIQKFGFFRFTIFTSLGEPLSDR